MTRQDICLNFYFGVRFLLCVLYEMSMITYIYQDSLTFGVSLKGDVVKVNKVLPSSLKRIVTVGSPGRDG